MGDPATQEPDLPRETHAGKRRVIGPGEERDEFAAKGGGDLLIGVEAECPGLGGESEGGVFGVAETLPRKVVDLSAGGERERFGGVGRGVEGDDDLGGPAADAGEATRKIGCFVFGDDDDGEGKVFNHGWT